MKNALTLYERASGQAINYAKLVVFCNPIIDVDSRRAMNIILGVSNPLNTGKYLGLLSLIGQGKLEIFHYLHEKLWNRLNHWRGKNSPKLARKFF